MAGRWLTTFAAMLGIAIPGLWLLSLATPGEEAVKIRNALVAELGQPDDFDWTPQQTPPGFLLNDAAPSPEFQQAADRLRVSGSGAPRQGLDLALAMARHLMGAPQRLDGAIQAGLHEAYTGITQQGVGYCADFTQVFTGLAVAAGLPVRTWSISFEGFGAGHAFNEIYDQRLGRWVLVDSYHSLLFLDAASREPLSVIEVHERLLAPADAGRSIEIQRIVPQRFPFPSDEMALDYYRRGMPQLALAWGNNVFDYDRSLPVRLAAGVSRHAERATGILVGEYPRLKVYPEDISARDLRSLDRIRQRFWLALGSLALASGVFGWLLWTTWRRPRHGLR
jgi:hypothetical protein